MPERDAIDWNPDYKAQCRTTGHTILRTTQEDLATAVRETTQDDNGYGHRGWRVQRIGKIQPDAWDDDEDEDDQEVAATQ